MSPLSSSFFQPTNQRHTTTRTSKGLRMTKITSTIGSRHCKTMLSSRNLMMQSVPTTTPTKGGRPWHFGRRAALSHRWAPLDVSHQRSSRTGTASRNHWARAHLAKSRLPVCYQTTPKSTQSRASRDHFSPQSLRTEKSLTT
jgi:hypothetical protein